MNISLNLCNCSAYSDTFIHVKLDIRKLIQGFCLFTCDLLISYNFSIKIDRFPLIIFIFLLKCYNAKWLMEILELICEPLRNPLLPTMHLLRQISLCYLKSRYFHILSLECDLNVQVFSVARRLPNARK